MNWFPVALTTALATASGDALLKARFSSMSPIQMAVVRAVSPIPFLLPVLVCIPWPEISKEFWTTVTMLVPLELAALTLYMKALKTSPISLSIPFLAFTPVFIVLTGWFILDEQVTTAGLAGILLTVAGAYILNLNKSVSGIFGPFVMIFKETGPLLMLMVALIYSITSVLGKKAVLQSGPFFFACFYFVLIGVATPLMALAASLFSTRVGHAMKGLRPNLGWWGVGLCQAVMVLTHMWAISLTQAAYMIAVKRTSLLFSVFYGKFIFREERIPERFAGTALMVAGVAIILIKG